MSQETERAQQVGRPGKMRGISALDLLTLPQDVGIVVKQIIRCRRLTLAQAINLMARPPAEVEMRLNDLVKRGYLYRQELDQEIWYQVRFGHTVKKGKSGQMQLGPDDQSE